MTGKGEKTTRAFETTLEIDAPVDVVWRALTDAEELTHWFPLRAKVEPGRDGSVWISWGEGWGWKMRIAIWEPGAHLRCVQEHAAPFDPVEGQTVPAPGPPVEIAVDYHLEARGGKTVIRLVHSGFGRGAEWDDEYQFDQQGLEVRAARPAALPRAAQGQAAAGGLGQGHDGPIRGGSVDADARSRRPGSRGKPRAPRGGCPLLAALGHRRRLLRDRPAVEPAVGLFRDRRGARRCAAACRHREVHGEDRPERLESFQSRMTAMLQRLCQG